jgi:hypothetical protein
VSLSDHAQDYDPRAEFASHWLNEHASEGDFQVLASARMEDVQVVVISDGTFATLFHAWLVGDRWTLGQVAEGIELTAGEFLTRGSFNSGSQPDFWYAKIFGRLPHLAPAALLVHENHVEPLVANKRGLFLYVRRMSGRTGDLLHIKVPGPHGRMRSLP